MSDDLRQPHIFEEVRSFSSGSTVSPCLCDGKCDRLGYCPRTETREQAIKRHQEAIDKLRESEDE